MRRAGSRAPRPRRDLAVVALVLASASVAHADGPVRHRHVPGIGAAQGALVTSRSEPEPTAFVYDGQLVPIPSGGPLATGETAMQSVPGDEVALEEPGRRSPSFRPDRVTALGGEVGYYEAFTPTISPFKRVTALDGIVEVDGVPVLSLAARGGRTRLVPEGASAPPPDARPRDRFWGSVVLDFGAGREVPLPSVSPESRILTLRTEPETPLRIERDGAGNYFAIAERSTRQQVRVVFLTDAPRRYFGGPLPTVPADALERDVAQVPPRVARRALEFAATLGLERGQPFDTTLARLVEWFRSFEESAEPPTNTGDIFWDLATGRRGVCRHRAYAFVVAAQSLGIHARFVQNEAHAWVEVDVPEGGGWMRIDLGGSPRGLTPRNTDARPAHRAETPDPLPRPEAYVRAYAEAARRLASGSGDSDAGASRTRATEGGEGRARPDGTSPPSGRASTDTAPSASRPTATVSHGTAPADTRARLDLELDRQVALAVLRGRSLEVSGVARSEGAGVAGLRIEVLLESADGGQPRLLGVTVTRDAGQFHAAFGVPLDLPVGDYRLLVRSPGDAHVGPALAR